MATGEFTLLGVGDLIMNKPDPYNGLSPIADYLRKGDITLGNLEGPVCDRGEPDPTKIEIGSARVRQHMDTPKALVDAGFHGVGVANNHGMDFGAEGLLQSLEILDKRGIARAGGGRNLEEAHAPAFLEHKGARVALLSYTSVFMPFVWSAREDRPGLATVKVDTSYQAPDNLLYQPGLPAITITTPDPEEQARMEEDVRRAKQQADLVVVCPHWGVSWGLGKVVGYQRELGRAAIDAGADLILGHHPHRLLGMELYKGRLICYSLGNFVLGHAPLPHFGAETGILKCYVKDGQFQRFAFIPAVINEDIQTVPLHGEKAQEVASLLDRLSQDFGTTFTLEGDEIVIGGPRPGTPEPTRGTATLWDSMVPLPYKKGAGPGDLLRRLEAQRKP